MVKTSVIKGITDQNGAYRRFSDANFSKLEEHGIFDNVELTELELLEHNNIFMVLQKFQPYEFYNLTAQSFADISFAQLIYTTQIDAIAITPILEAIRIYSPDTRFYQASTSEMVGLAQEISQSKNTPFYLKSPYGVAKLNVYWLNVNYIEFYNLHVSSKFLFNHESAMKGKEFVTRKIYHFTQIVCKTTEQPLELGNLSSKKEWGFTGDYIEAMWLMLPQEIASDYVIATGETYQIIDFINLAANFCDFSLEGEGEIRKAINRKNNKTVVEVNSKFYLPAEIDIFIGNSKKDKK